MSFPRSWVPIVGLAASLLVAHPARGADCKGLLECYGACPPASPPCIEACEARAPEHAARGRAALLCVANSGCAEASCIDAKCRSELAACLMAPTAGTGDATTPAGPEGPAARTSPGGVAVAGKVALAAGGVEPLPGEEVFLHPSIAVDPQGRIFLAAAGTKLLFGQCAGRCADVKSWRFNRLDNDELRLERPTLRIAPDGSPRLLTHNQVGPTHGYYYAACSGGDCLSGDRWRMRRLPAAPMGGPTDEGYFDVLPGDGAILAYGGARGLIVHHCPGNCVEGAWSEMTLTNKVWGTPVVSAGPGGEIYIIGSEVQEYPKSMTVVFACRARCGEAASWRGVNLLPTTSRSHAEVRALPGGGAVAVEWTGKQEQAGLSARLLVATCASDCGTAERWTRDVLPHEVFDDGLALAVDARGRARVGFAVADGFKEARCDGRCDKASSWSIGPLESSAAVGQRHPAALRKGCTGAFWHPEKIYDAVIAGERTLYGLSFEHQSVGGVCGNPVFDYNPLTNRAGSQRSRSILTIGVR